MLVTSSVVLLLTASMALGVGLVAVDQERRRAELAEEAKGEALQRVEQEKAEKEEKKDGPK